MLHYTAGTDVSAVEWLLFDKRCQVSYNWLILEDGTSVNVAPKDRRAWHAGVCRPAPGTYVYTDANSAFYGIAIAAEAGDTATPKQLEMVVSLVALIFRKHGWTAMDLASRLTDHAAEAWPRGRKHDTGTVLPVARVRALVADRLAARVAA
jgi:N-acetyl-anhydromuramyl-L-alanine amidase AmpD